MEFFIFLYAYYVKGYISKDSSSIMIEYYLRKGVQKVELIYNYKGEDYHVCFHRNIYPERELRDTILWVTKEKWRKEGNLKLRVYYSDDFSPLMGETKEGVKEYFISGKNLPILDFGIKKTKEKYYLNKALVKTYQGPDKYSWRMLGYDAQHTGYYPFVLYPPLEYKWQWNWGGAGSWTAEISGCAGQNMLFIPKAPWEWNKIMALDIETGQIIWERRLTSNVWTAALDPNDSILFVGTSIGIPPDSYPTFFALDPFTGEEKWSKIINTVEFQPIIVDTIVYVPSLGGSVVGDYNITFAYTLKGNFIWKEKLTGETSPAYWNGKIYGSRNRVPVQPDTVPDIFYCRDALTGDSIWAYQLPSNGGTPTIRNNKVFLFSSLYPYGIIFSFNSLTGNLLWQKNDFPLTSSLFFTVIGDFLIVQRAYWGTTYEDTVWTTLYKLDPLNGQELWRDTLSNGRITGIGIGSKDNYFWLTGQWIYLVDMFNDSLISKLLEVPRYSERFRWGSNFFPIAYKNYFIGAHQSALYVYKTDTILPPPPETTYVFNFYPYYSSGNLYFYISLPYDNKISIKIYDISGKEVKTIFNGSLLKGKYFLNTDTRGLSSGIYFAYLKTQTLKRVKKFIYKRR